MYAGDQNGFSSSSWVFESTTGSLSDDEDSAWAKSFGIGLAAPLQKRQTH
jgi:hypothetical protein